MITFNNVPDTVRTPGVYAEIDNSRALQGLSANPQKALIIGEKISSGLGENEILYNITRKNLSDGFFGTGSLLARMCNIFKDNNPNTELKAIALSGGTLQASARIAFSLALSHAAGSCSAGAQNLFILINGQKVTRTLTSGWSAVDIASDAAVYISEQANFPVTASVIAVSGVLVLSALNSGAHGNYLDVRVNFFDGESNPTFFGDSVLISNFEGGLGAGDLTDAWAVVDNEQFHYIVQPYLDSTNLKNIEDELADRFKPLEDKQGHGFVGLRGNAASCTTLGNARNSPHNTIMGAYDSPIDPSEWGAALGAIAAFNLNDDPGRPLHYLKLENILAPPTDNRFSRTERDTLLYDGIATFITDDNGNVLIERSITSYQKDQQGVPDPSYLDVQTLAILSEIRYQFKIRMTNRFKIPRFKLADDTFPVLPGQKVATPRTVKQEIIALFTQLRDKGLIENLDDFVANLVVERSEADKNRVNVLLPPDLINQFRALAGLVQFIL